MLVTLSIKNFILIESLSLDLSKGLYVISGETGAGKSILLDSILFALGSKFDSNIVKPGADFASVTAEFSVSGDIVDLAKEYGIDITDSLIIKRQEYQNGKKKFFINDEPVTGKLISTISDNLVEMHGQHGYGRLLNPLNHLKILDKFGDLEELRGLVEGKYREYKKLESDIESVERDRNYIIREIDYLEHVVTELTSKCPGLGEEECLVEKRIRLRGLEKRKLAIKEIQNIFNEADIDSKTSSMQRIASNQDESFGALIENLDQLQIYSKEVENSIYELEKNEIDDSLEDVETRLFEIRDLSRKYNLSSSDLAAHLEKSQAELDILRGKIDNSDNMSKDLDKAKSAYNEFANLLSEKRRISAKILEEKVGKELVPLNMENCRWFVEVTKREEASSLGIDNIRFAAITNPGSDPAPIDKIASGGEMARMMLAVKLALFDKDYVPTIIFDEIDTGLGGKVADSVGVRLKALSKIVQTIIITHQPQVASKADYNILVTKKNSVSSAKILDEKETNEEIARMISGAEVTQKAIEAAKELIDR